VRFGEEVVENGPFKDQVVQKEVMEEVFGDPVKWKGVMRKLFSSRRGKRRGDEKVF
jgi:hypothetical protein